MLAGGVPVVREGVGRVHLEAVAVPAGVRACRVGFRKPVVLGTQGGSVELVLELVDVDEVVLLLLVRLDVLVLDDVDVVVVVVGGGKSEPSLAVRSPR